MTAKSWDSAESQLADAIRERDELKIILNNVINSVMKNDKTNYGKPYTYGMQNRDGESPNKGERWLTPYEIAKTAKRELEELQNEKL